jgi:predicted enzyme related to lactoylglutathione lyase
VGRRLACSAQQAREEQAISEREGYRHGVPCWVAAVVPNPQAAVDFYTGLFGWEAADTMPLDGPGRYFVCTLHGRDVAAIGSGRGGAAASIPAWDTYIWVDNADQTAARAADTGGTVVAAPFDLLDAGRLAVLADPAGAVFCAFQPNRHRGAQVVNEPGAWSMSSLNTADPDGARSFYGALFDWEADTMDFGGMAVTLWRLPGFEGGEPGQPVPADVVGVMLPQDAAGSPDDPPPLWSVDFWVSDADATASRAADLGGRVLAPPFESPVGRTGVLADPQGATFSISKAPT